MTDGPTRIAAMAGALLLLAAAPAHAQEAHGAIAFGGAGYEDFVAYGLSWNYATKDEAVGAAVDTCRGAGGTACTELAWFRNGCGALALDRYGGAQGMGARSREQAEARALRSCEAAGGSGCAIVDSQCADPGGEPGTWSGSESVQGPAEEKPAGGAASAGDGAKQPDGADAASEEALTREERIMAQRGLAALGYDPGPADSLFGPRTRSAIWEWQEAKGNEAMGYLTREEAEALAAAGADAPRQAASPEADGAKDRRQAAAPETADGPRPFKKKVLRLLLCENIRTDAEGSECCRALPDRPGCRFWTNYYLPNRTVTWSGGCDGDTAHGQGTLSHVWDKGSAEDTGHRRAVRRQETWTLG